MTDFRILAVSIGAPPELDVVSTVGASAETVMFCVSPFSFSWKSSFAGSSDLIVTCFVTGSKPASVTVTSYSPYQHAREAVSAEIARHRRNLCVRADALQRDPRVGPDRLHVVGVDGKDDAADAGALGGSSGRQCHHEQHCDEGPPSRPHAGGNDESHCCGYCDTVRSAMEGQESGVKSAVDLALGQRLAADMRTP